MLRASGHLQNLLDDIGVDEPFLDAQRLGDGFPNLLAQFRSANRARDRRHGHESVRKADSYRR